MNIKKFHVLCSCITCRTEITTAKLNAHYEVCGIMHKCAFCGNKIHRKKKFCNQSCAAKFNNANRTEEQHKKQGKTLSASKSPATINGVCVLCSNAYSTTNKRQNICDICSKLHSTDKQKRVHAITRFCPKCNKFEFTFGRFQAETCATCRTLVEYRTACTFTHDLNMYPSEYQLVLLKEHGMFHPKKNPKGVSRDHLYSVFDGYNNKVDPSIMKHPANCQLMLQEDNTRKNSNSSITLDELLERIKLWNERYS